MREILSTAAMWARDGEPFAIATLVGVSGSGPRELGASMIVSADGRVFGNVSGGCVESAVLAECETAIASGESSLHRFGISDDDMFAIGLTCGGTVDVLVRPVPPGSRDAEQLITLAEREQEGLPVALALTISGEGLGESTLLTGEETSNDRAMAEATALMAGDRAEHLHLDGGGCRVTAESAEHSLLVIPFGSPPRLIIIGAVEFSVALARLGAVLGFAVTVVDPRTVFASEARFPDAEVVTEWPDRYLARTRIDSAAAVCVLSHDPRFDVPALRVALESPAGYVGAMGSRRTHDDRMRRLAEAGVLPAATARLRSPIGLHLGGRRPEETALSILAEIVAVRHGASGQPLSKLQGSVHGSSLVGAAPAWAADLPALSTPT